jgi:hypothetical protein
MVLKYETMFGYKKDEGPAQPGLSFENDEDPEEKKESQGEKMVKYKSLIDNLVEKGARHLKGEELKVSIDAERAAALINAGYIEEVVEVKEEVKPETKNIEAPIKKVITADDTDKKGATGKGASLLKNKKR